MVTTGLKQWYRRQAIGVFQCGRTLPGIEEASADVHIRANEQVNLTLFLITISSWIQPSFSKFSPHEMHPSRQFDS